MISLSKINSICIGKGTATTEIWLVIRSEVFRSHAGMFLSIDEALVAPKYR